MSVTKSGFRVRIEDRDLWQARLIEAQEQRREPTERTAYLTPGMAIVYEQSFASRSEPGVTRHVTLRDTGSALYAVCDCPAGMHGKPCVHVAAAITASDLWPFEIAAMQELPLGLDAARPDDGVADPTLVYQLTTPSGASYRIEVTPGWLEQLDEDCGGLDTNWTATVAGDDAISGYGSEPETAARRAITTILAREIEARS